MSDRIISDLTVAFYDADDGTASATGIMDEDLVGDWVNIEGCDGGVQIAVTHTAGTSPVGVLRLQASDSPDDPKLDAVDVPDSDIDVPIAVPSVGSSSVGATTRTGIFNIDGDRKPGKWVRPVYDFTSGTALLTCKVQGQGVRT